MWRVKTKCFLEWKNCTHTMGDTPSRTKEVPATVSHACTLALLFIVMYLLHQWRSLVSSPAPSPDVHTLQRRDREGQRLQTLSRLSRGLLSDFGVMPGQWADLDEFTVRRRNNPTSKEKSTQTEWRFGLLVWWKTNHRWVWCFIAWIISMECVKL